MEGRAYDVKNYGAWGLKFSVRRRSVRWNLGRVRDGPGDLPRRPILIVCEEQRFLVPHLSWFGACAVVVCGMVPLGRADRVLDRLQSVRRVLHDDAEVPGAQPNGECADRVASPG